jgi:hypothetical protein
MSAPCGSLLLSVLSLALDCATWASGLLTLIGVIGSQCGEKKTQRGEVIMLRLIVILMGGLVYLDGVG